MKIRFRKNTNIRSAPGALENDPLGIVYAGTVLEIEDQIHEGAAIDSNSKWFRDHNGWFYWSGETEILQGITAAAPAPASAIMSPPVVEEAEPTPEDETRGAELHTITYEPAPVVPKETVSTELESVMIAPQPTPEVISFQKPELVTPAIPESQGVFTPDHERLNWGIENYELQLHWWQEHRLTGRGITVALLSTGAALEHPDLAGAVVRTFNAINATAAPLDQHGLGTQAAVLVGGRGHIAFGVAPEASLLIGKIGEFDQDITPENLIAGLNWAIDAEAHIIALMVDFRELSAEQKQNLQRAIDRAYNRNIVLLAPVGNSIERKPENRFPASLDGVLSIGAHDIYGQRCTYSAKSYHLDILAPGEGLLTSNPDQQPSGTLKTTAIATTFTAGFLALVRQWEIRNNRLSTPQDLAERLRSTAAAHKTITKGNDVEYGYGLLNPMELLKSLEST